MGTASKNILVVEDEPAVRLVLCDGLRRAGYRVLAAARGEEALALASTRDTELDLLLCDLVLPGMSGVDVAERLTELHPGLRTVFMSGHDEEAIARYGLRIDQVRYLGKPFTCAMLTDRVREALEA